MSIISLILAPINLLVSSAFPSFDTWVSRFTFSLNTYFGNSMGWVFNFLPDMLTDLILFYVSLLIVIYTISWTIYGIIKVIAIIKKIKIW